MTEPQDLQSSYKHHEHGHNKAKIKSTLQIPNTIPTVGFDHMFPGMQQQPQYWVTVFEEPDITITEAMKTSKLLDFDLSTHALATAMFDTVCSA